MFNLVRTSFRKFVLRTGGLRTWCTPLIAGLVFAVPYVAGAQVSSSGGGSTPYIGRYEPSKDRGLIRMSNTVERKNCSPDGKTAVKCEWPLRDSKENQPPLDSSGQIKPPLVDTFKKILNYPVLPREREAIHLPDRLLQLLVHLSDTFTGAQICVVSGFRCWEKGGQKCSEFQKDTSMHLSGAAADVVMLGIDNVDLATYALYLQAQDPRFAGKIGVGFYPNREHVHLDAREKPAYWVDYSPQGDPQYDSDKPPPAEAFFKHFDARYAMARPGGRCPTVAERDAVNSDEVVLEDSAPFKFRWQNVLFTEPPLQGTPSSRALFQGKDVDFSLLKELDGFEQL